MYSHARAVIAIIVSVFAESAHPEIGGRIALTNQLFHRRAEARMIFYVRRQHALFEFGSRRD